MPLDIGVGILLALGVAELTGIEASPAFIVLGILFTLLPDIDVLTLPLLGKWYHRTHTHYPLVYVPIAILACILLPLPYALLFTLGVYAHLVHDTFGIGWGIAWFWPFSERKYLLFPEKTRKLGRGRFASWLPEEEASLHDAPIDQHWIRYYYFRPNSVAYIEYGTLLLSLVVLAVYLS